VIEEAGYVAVVHCIDGEDVVVVFVVVVCVVNVAEKVEVEEVRDAL